jgi:hypothetical protein
MKIELKGVTAMRILAFDENPDEIRELRSIDHNSKEYKSKIKKYVARIGLMNLVTKSLLNENVKEKQLQWKYKKNLLIILLHIVLMFALIFITVALTGEKELYQFNQQDICIFITFILVELASAVSMFVFAFRAQRTLIEILSLWVDNYGMDRNGT